MTALLEVEALRHTVDGICLLESLTFSAEAGQFIAIVGPNGAGKTTLLRAIAGITAASGVLRVDGTDVRTLSPRARAKRIAFVAVDDAAGSMLTVRDVVAEGRYAHRRGMLDNDPAHHRVVELALDRTELRALADRRLGSLSSGERRRTWIALGLAQEADILLLDEPTANLDIYHAQQTLRTMRALADGGKVIVTVLHDLNEAAQFADRIALVDRARLIAYGAPDAVLTPDRLARCYGVQVEVVTSVTGSIRVFPCS